MSRGPGIVQRRQLQRREPTLRLGVECGEQSEIAWPGEVIEHKHRVSVSRALPGVKLDRDRSRRYGRAGIIA
jgi:hypothetical protein